MARRRDNLNVFTYIYIQSSVVNFGNLMARSFPALSTEFYCVATRRGMIFLIEHNAYTDGQPDDLVL